MSVRTVAVVEPPIMILSMLHELRTDLNDGFDRINRTFVRQDRRFDTLEEHIDEVQLALCGQPALRRYGGGEADSELATIETVLMVAASFDEPVRQVGLAPPSRD